MLFPMSWSPDGRWLLALVHASETDIGCALVDVEALTVREVIAPNGMTIGGPWQEDSSGFHAISNLGCEFTGVGRYRLDDGATSMLMQGAWDITDFRAQASTVLWVTNESGVDRLDVTREGIPIDMSALPQGRVEVPTLSGDGRRMAMVVSTPTMPEEVVVIDVPDVTEGDAARVRVMTRNRAGVAVASELVEPESVVYLGAEGVKVQGWLYRPDAEASVPLVVSVHDGPGAQARAEYGTGMAQWLVALGFAVFEPNIRGSAGFGRSHQQAIYGDWGGADVEDVRCGAMFARSLPGIREDSVSLVGDGYGGFVVLSLLARRPDLPWAAGVAISPPTDLVALVTAAPQIAVSSLVATVGEPVLEREGLTERSPITHVAEIRAPLMIVQGARDPMVLKRQTDTFVAAANAAGVDVTYVVDDDRTRVARSLSQRASDMVRIGEYLAGHLSD
jgi:dipeptidyl aminopeptidase/acylaminoacyl peptidase